MFITHGRESWPVHCEVGVNTDGLKTLTVRRKSGYMDVRDHQSLHDGDALTTR